ncbi:MAG: CPBP family intramembrane metalloprotease [Terracidiphilus sp.]|nr:CPBP family intramembrane metalloprotease [Terracidiphilus sp.]
MAIQPTEVSTEAKPLFSELKPAEPQGPPEPDRLAWVFMGSDGLRAGWSIAIFIPAMILIASMAGGLLYAAHLMTGTGHGSPRGALFGELMLVAGLAGAAALVALVERRPKNLLEYNLIGPKRGLHFSVGLVAGFAALSALVGGLKAGGWLTLSTAGLSYPHVAKYAAAWAVAFLLVGLYEEGTFRCYLQATLARGLNLWWALGLEAAMCGFLVWRGKGNGVWGVFAMALSGLAPCLWLAWKRTPSAGFWLAAWVGSTLFGFVHTGNNGENWIGIFAAAAIGFVFVASVRLTGSAWWAIGFHASWDWAETFFFGTADSGMPAHGSLLVSKPAGDPFWSGGTDGPEGSMLVLAVILLVLTALVAVYGRGRGAAVDCKIAF